MEKILAVIVAVAIVIFGAVLIFLSRQRKRRMVRIQEVKDMFAKRVSIPPKYAEAFGKAKSEREIINVAMLIAESYDAWAVSFHGVDYDTRRLPFSKIMRNLADSCNSVGKNSAPSNKVMEADFSTPIRHESPRVRPWYENYTDPDHRSFRRDATSTNSVTEQRHHYRRYRDDDNDYTLPVAAAAVFTAAHSSSSCNSVSYERGHACERPSSGGYGGGESSDGGGGSSCGDSGGGGD